MLSANAASLEADLHELLNTLYETSVTLICKWSKTM